MPMSFRTIVSRVVPVVTLIALGAGGIAAGTAAAAGGQSNAAPHRARIAQPPPVDHQLCYNASSQFSIPGGITLINQFSPNGFVPVISPALIMHCNPVQKTVLTTGQVFPITNPDAHLACFPLRVTSPQPTPTVVVANQFGSATLVPSQPNIFCAPSWKSLTGPPMKSPTTPPGLNHFTCYPVTVKSGSYTPPPIALQDEFAPSPVSVQVSPIPQELCLPTEKILPTGQVFPIINPTLHLLCFPVSQTPFKTPVWDENQFGTSPVTINSTKWLCLPSTKTVIG